MDSKEKLREKYFSFGFRQKEILECLKYLHGIEISMRTLKRKLQNLGLYRRKNFTKIEDTVHFIQSELSYSGQMHGYKWMHLKCIQNGIVVTQDIVRELLLLLDPEGVDIRKRKKLRRRRYSTKGPNYLWHMDSYDKLKPYGICINGCIDGFSRHIIWLYAASTASDPKVIGGYYLNSLKDLDGCPITIRSDMGTENGVVEKIQIILRELSTDGSERPSHIYGKSTGNQRIEAWWSFLRKQKSQYWINIFETLRDEGLFDGSFLDKALIQYCFLDIIQHELDEIVFEWNTHRIRNTRNSNAPTGRPMVMFEMPNLFQAENYLISIPMSLFSILEEECTFLKYSCDEDVYNMCNYVVAEKNLLKNNDPYVAYQLYIELRRELRDLL